MERVKQVSITEDQIAVLRRNGFKDEEILGLTWQQALRKISSFIDAPKKKKYYYKPLFTKDLT